MITSGHPVNSAIFSVCGAFTIVQGNLVIVARDYSLAPGLYASCSQVGRVISARELRIRLRERDESWEEAALAACWLSSVERGMMLK